MELGYAGVLLPAVPVEQLEFHTARRLGVTQSRSRSLVVVELVRRREHRVRLIMALAQLLRERDVLEARRRVRDGVGRDGRGRPRPQHERVDGAARRGAARLRYDGDCLSNAGSGWGGAGWRGVGWGGVVWGGVW